MGAILDLVDPIEDDAPQHRALAPLAAVLDVGVSKTVCLAARRDPVAYVNCKGRGVHDSTIGTQRRGRR